MKNARRGIRRVSLGLCLVAALALAGWSLAGCGGSTEKSSSSSNTKLPPGVTESDSNTQSTTAQSTQAQSTTATESESTTATAAQSTTATQAATPSAAADLVGARFTVVSATRPDSNKSVISSGAREVKGDYFNIELTVQDIATDHLVDLSEYVFRLKSEGIDADSYSDYYGETGTYGAYVSTNVISGILQDLTNLQAVNTKLKVGETLEDVFLFYDLNPQNVGRNPGVTKDNTVLQIRKVSGNDYGEYVEIPLAGYPD
jgi:hypothetical protein